MLISDNHVKYFAFGMGLIGICIIAITPFLTNEASLMEKSTPTAMERMCRVNVSEVDWEFVVVHHSATKTGNAARFDDYHKNKKKWKYGLAYHFVIGNGSQSGDGEIEIGSRWVNQIHGAHTSIMEVNRVGIGICLVGNFDKSSKTTQKQMLSLLNLTTHLCKKYNIPITNVIGHHQVQKNHTVCPGKNFPLEEFKRKLSQALMGGVG